MYIKYIICIPKYCSYTLLVKTLAKTIFLKGYGKAIFCNM